MLMVLFQSVIVCIDGIMEQQRGRSRARGVVPVRKRRSTSLPARINDNMPLQPNWDKLHQVLDYSRSLDKVCSHQLSIYIHC